MSTPIQKPDPDYYFNIVREKFFNQDYYIKNVYEIKMEWYVPKKSNNVEIQFYAQIESIMSVANIIGFKFKFLKKNDRKGSSNTTLIKKFYPIADLYSYKESLINIEIKKKLKTRESSQRIKDLQLESEAILNLINTFKKIGSSNNEIEIYKPSAYRLTNSSNAKFFWERLSCENSKILFVPNSIVSFDIHSLTKNKYASYISKLEKKNTLGNTPLINAVMSNDYNLVSFYLSIYSEDYYNNNNTGDNNNIYLNIDAQNNESNSALMIAVKNENLKIIKLLIKYNADPTIPCGIENLSPIFYSIKHDKPPISGVILKELFNLNGSAINIKNTNGDTPLLFAIKNKKINMIKFLITSKADINSADENGNTPFMLSLEYSNYKIIKILLKERNIDIFLTNNNSTNALMFAAGAKRDEINIIKFLITNGINPHNENIIGQNALNYAVENNNIVIAKYLLDNYNLYTTIFENIEKNYLSPLEIAILNKDLKMFKLLTSYLRDKKVKIVISAYDLLNKIGKNISVFRLSSNDKSGNDKLKKLYNRVSVLDINSTKPRTKEKKRKNRINQYVLEKEIEERKKKIRYNKIIDELEVLPIYNEKLKILETAINLELNKVKLRKNHAGVIIITTAAIDVLKSIL